jgi:hypothetical protein
MTRYTVAWHTLAENELAEIWLNSLDRKAITEAAHQIDKQLAEDPLTRGTVVSQRSRELTVKPRQVLFRVLVDDRIVQIFGIARSEPGDG